MNNTNEVRPEVEKSIAMGPVRSFSKDSFICHAKEDKQAIVEPLALQLNRLGARVWYDKWSLEIGDSLRQKIDEGLRDSRFGIVVLSKNFFAKKWPQTELDGLVEREM